MNEWFWLALLSAALFSLKDIVAKNLFNHHAMKADNAVIQEYAGYLVFTGVLAMFIDWGSILTVWPLLLLKAFMVGSAGMLYFTLLEKHDISMTAPLLNLSPVFLLIISAVFLSEAVSWMQLLGVVLIVLATYYLEVILRHHEHKQAHTRHWYHMCKKDIYFFGTVVAMLITISITAVTDKLLLQQINWQTNLFFLSIIILILYTIIKSPKKLLQSMRLFKDHPKTLGFVGLNVVSTICVLLAIAIPTSLVSLIIPIRRTSTLFTAVFGGLLFHEDHIIKKMLTVFIMLVGIMLMVI